MNLSKEYLESPAEQSVVRRPKNPIKENLEDYGFRTAGINNGSLDTFVHGLDLIRNGDIYDASIDMDSKQQQQEEVEDKIDELKNLNTEHASEIKSLSTIIIPSIKDKITAAKDKIDEIRISIASQKASSSFHWGRFIASSLVVAFLGVYLFVFYSSTLYAAFFNDVLQKIESADNAEIGLLLNSIFNPEAFLNPGTAGYFTYLGTSFIFGLGLLPHYFLSSDHPKVWRTVGTIFGFLLPLALDAMLAYKIDSSIEQVKVLIGMETSDAFYLHINFWLVIAFGYLAYFVWSLFLESCFTQWDKRDPALEAQAKISVLESKILEHNEETTKRQLEIANLEQSIDKNASQMDTLHKSKGSFTYSEADLKISLTSYVNGFFKYLNNLSGSGLLVAECRNAYHEFQEEHFPAQKLSTLN